jgi:hypothetical protein
MAACCWEARSPCGRSVHRYPTCQVTPGAKPTRESLGSAKVSLILKQLAKRPGSKRVLRSLGVGTAQELVVRPERSWRR